MKASRDSIRERMQCRCAFFTIAIQKSVFEVGAFSLREKCPTIAVTFFFLQTTYLTLIGQLFRNIPETT